MDTNDDLEHQIRELEKANRILKKKLERSEINRLQLEETHERQQRILYQTIQGLEQSLHELQKAQLQLVQSEKMSALGNLVAGVAHEINNPVGFVAGNLCEAQRSLRDLCDHLDLYRSQASATAIEEHAETINLDFLLEDLPEILNSMEVGCERIRNISTSLRSFTRADKDYKVPFDIHEGLDNTLLILKHRLRANEIRPAIQVITEYGQLPMTPCFPGQLKQVFMNILANAIDVLDESNNDRRYEEIENNPNWIKIRTSTTEDQVIIRIADNGKGIPAEIKNHIFDYLFTTKEMGKGTGLGLAIAHQIIVDKHGGQLEVNSELGQGAEFVIYLPLMKKESENIDS